MEYELEVDSEVDWIVAELRGSEVADQENKVQLETSHWRCLALVGTGSSTV